MAVNGSGGPESGVKHRQAIRRQQVTELRRAGWKQRAIAEHVGCSPATVKNDLRHVRQMLNADTAENAAAIRADQVATLHRVREEAFEMVAELRDAQKQQGMVLFDADGVEVVVEIPLTHKAAQALNVVIRSVEREARLMGTDAPEQVQMTGRLELITEQEARETLAKLPPPNLTAPHPGVVISGGLADLDPDDEARLKKKIQDLTSPDQMTPTVHT